MDTTTHLDYISISAKPSDFGFAHFQELPTIQDAQAAAFAMLGEFPQFCRAAAKDAHQDLGGKNGFTMRRFYPLHGWTLFAGAWHGRILIQLPGEACHALRQEPDGAGGSKSLNLLLMKEQFRITKLDLCTNWRTTKSVDEIAGSFSKKDMKDYPRIPSETGLSQYIGSRTSDKFAIVYVWFAPHPRHEWVRIEFKTKAETAEVLRRNILKEGLLPPFKRMLFDWGFSDETMINSMSIGPEGERVAYQQRAKGGSLAWLYGTCIVSLKKAIDRGLIPPADVYSLLGLKSPDDPL